MQVFPNTEENAQLLLEWESKYTDVRHLSYHYNDHESDQIIKTVKYLFKWFLTNID